MLTISKIKIEKKSKNLVNISKKGLIMPSNYFALISRWQSRNDT